MFKILIHRITHIFCIPQSQVCCLSLFNKLHAFIKCCSLSLKIWAEDLTSIALLLVIPSIHTLSVSTFSLVHQHISHVQLGSPLCWQVLHPVIVTINLVSISCDKWQMPVFTALPLNALKSQFQQCPLVLKTPFSKMWHYCGFKHLAMKDHEIFSHSTSLSSNFEYLVPNQNTTKKPLCGVWIAI